MGFPIVHPNPEQTEESTHFISTETARVRYLHYFLDNQGSLRSKVSFEEVMAKSKNTAPGILDLKDYASFMRGALKNIDPERLPYLITKDYVPALSGSLGFLLSAQPSGRDVLNCLAKYAHQFSTFDAISWFDKGDLVMIKYNDLCTIEDFVLNTELKSLNLLRLLHLQFGSESILNVRLGFGTPDYAKELQEEFPFDIRFEAGSSYYYLTPSVLSSTTNESNAMLASAIEALIERSELKLGPKPMDEQVMDALFENIQMNLQETAEVMNLTARTVQRKLSQLGTSFKVLRENAVKEQAIVLLLCTEMSVGEISEALNFSELSSFYRAFRQWTKETPAKFRKLYKKELLPGLAPDKS